MKIKQVMVVAIVLIAGGLLGNGGCNIGGIGAIGGGGDSGGTVEWEPEDTGHPDPNLDGGGATRSIDGHIDGEPR